MMKFSKNRKKRKRQCALRETKLIPNAFPQRSNNRYFENNWSPSSNCPLKGEEAVNVGAVQ